MTMNDKVRLVVIEDQYDIAEALCHVISSAHGFSCVAKYHSAEEAMLCIENNSADIYLVDLGLPGMSGVDFIAEAKVSCPDADFVVYTLSESGKDLIDALSVGAVGYIVKGCSDQELIDGLSIVADGGGLIGPRMARRLFSHFQGIGPRKKKLTPTETDVLQKLKTGKTYNQIAASNHVSRSTVQSHVKNIYKKLNVRNRDDAVRTGVLFHLIDD